MARSAGAKTAWHLVLQTTDPLERNEQTNRMCACLSRVGPPLSLEDRTCIPKGRGRIFFSKLDGSFSGGPVVKTSPSNTGGVDSISDQEAKILYALQPKNKQTKNVKQKQYCNKINKDFKNGPH